MLQLNEDVLFLTFEELKDDKESLHSCLLVNRTWCEIAVPILWRNPKIVTLSEKATNALLNVIFLHLSKESRLTLKSHGINNLITKTFQHPLFFNYIGFWKYLDLSFVENLISRRYFEKSKVSIVRDEIMKLFISGNTNFNYLYIPHDFNYQLHHIPGVERSFSELEYFHCRCIVDQRILEGISSICKSIKKLVIVIDFHSTHINYGMIKLIEAQKNLNEVHLLNFSGHKLLEKSIEESLIKHADTIQFLKIELAPVTKFLSYLVNLSSLEINLQCFGGWYSNYFKNLSSPNLKTLKARRVPSKALANLIENTKGLLSEINIIYDDASSKMLIQAIYQNCQNLMYLKLLLDSNSNSIISEFESLLMNCQFLNELIIIGRDYDYGDKIFNWGKLFKVLAKSSPISLLKFNFYSINMIKLEDIKLFFDNWKNRNPILLRIGSDDYYSNVSDNKQFENLCELYKLEGVIKKYHL